MIVITGASGRIGGEAARILHESGVPIRVLTRDAVRAAHLRNAEVVVADYLDGTRLADAIDPGDRVFMVSIDAAHDERMARHESFIEAARRADAGLLVYLSFQAAAPDAAFAHAVAHAETERLIEAAGVPAVILRTSLYQNSSSFFFEHGVCVGPAGDGAVSWVSRRDVGAAVAAVLRGRGQVGATYDLTGPEAIGIDETAARVGRLLGVGLDYVDRDDPARLSLRGLPDPVALRSTRRSCLVSIAAGQQDLVTDDLERLSGVAPSTLDRHIVTYPEQFLRAADRI